MAPDSTQGILQLLFTASPTAAVLLFMWMNRNPAPKAEENDPAKRLLAELEDIKERIIDLQAEMKVLLDRRKP